MCKTASNGSLLCGLVVVCALACPCGAQTIWTGPTITFTRPNSVDWNLPENQDRMTDTVWITRKNTQGIFNIAQEAGYSFISPVDTEWAYGSADNYQNLTFAPWIVWHGQFPPGMVGEIAVVHLITDDIYVDIMFTSWQAGGGGGFSYERSTPFECFQVTGQEVVCHGDGETFTYTVTGTDSCSGVESSYVFTASGGAVGEQMCFTLVVTGEGGDYCCITEICFIVPSCTDCNNNGIPDGTDITDGTSQDCNGNGVPDECDLADGTSSDCNANGVPDECETDCNGNGVPDECDFANGTSSDCNANGIPDECDIASAPETDCNGNGVPDECDLADGTSTDVNGNGLPDECECVADINGSGSVDMGDLVGLLASWGPCEPGCFGDLDVDGNVGITDFLIMLANWGPCP